ncbi:hypothetical protein H7U20_12385 [Rugamonas sp. CCM 8940]|nr:hypothetical protein [Rugamonas sp. CCM 8940]
MKLFSERNEYVKEAIHLPEAVTSALRNRLWNVIEMSVQSKDFGKITIAMWHHLYKLPISSRVEVTDFMGHIDWSRTWVFIQRQFMGGPWHSVYDHLEFLMQLDGVDETDINRELEAEAAPYPVVVNKVVASLHAASFTNSGSARSGLSQTSSFNFQSLVAPDQRSGQRCLAAS